MEPSEFIQHEKKQQSKPVIIGRGGSSELYRVMIHNKYHVLKKLKEEHKNSQQHIQSLVREFETGFQLDHPNIVRYIEYNSKDEEHSILLEFIDGSTLKDVINKHSISLSIEEKKIIILTLCNTIEYLHSKQTYHLDLKPENILITFRGKNLKLIDFGHSLTDSNINKLGGTKSYMKPDQKDNLFNSTDDIYAIGKIVDFLFSNESIKTKSCWKKFIDNCTNSESKNSFSSIPELIETINKINQKSKTKIVLYSLSVTIILIICFFLIQYRSPNHKNKAINRFDYKNTTSILPKQKEPIVKLENSDSTYLVNLGSSLYYSFVKKYNKSDKSIKTGSNIQTDITDSIQSEWFKYSEKFQAGSPEHKQAYDNFNPNFTESQKKIMELLYGSK